MSGIKKQLLRIMLADQYWLENNSLIIIFVCLFEFVLYQENNNQLRNMQGHQQSKLLPTTEQEVIKSLPSQEYLEKVFRNLEKLKRPTIYPQIPIGTVFNGFKTIPIQKLPTIHLIDLPKKTSNNLWNTGLVHKVLHYEESCHLSKDCINGFLGAFIEAYKNHGDVRITPDDLWAAIMLYFSRYVDQNAEQLREAFVCHQGKIKLSVETTWDLKEAQWNQFLEKIVISVKQNTSKGITERLECSFSTTGIFFRFFSSTIIMNSYKSYFSYERHILACGIQNIHMGGVLEDWVKLYEKLCSLSEYDVDGRLKKYVERLKPVIGQLIETYKGHANVEFWNNIYHERQNPEAELYERRLFANGWILRFFTLSDVIQDVVHMQEIDVPIKINNKILNTVKIVNLVGGCRGISIEGNVYRPHYSFAIVQKLNEYDQNREFQQQADYQEGYSRDYEYIDQFD